MKRIILAIGCSATLAAASARAQTAAPAPHQHGQASSQASDEGAKVPVHQPHAQDKNPPKPTGSMVELKVDAATSAAYVARPKTAPKGSVLVLHEWWGLNDWVKHMADELAGQGYLALAIDLYKGKVATDPKEAGALMGAKDEKWGDAVEEAGLEWLKTNASGAKIATIGWCMGGGESLNSSLHDPKDVDATVIYYGMPVSDVAKLKTLKGPVLGLFAKKDGWITPDKVAEFDKALTEAGVKHELHSYDADHAFANPTGGKYNGKDAKDAWEKTTAFLAANLAK